MKASFHVILVEPEIPPNTGNIGRLCLATGSTLHLIEPLGFRLDEKSLRRAGLDYWDQVTVRQWPSFDAFRDWFSGTYPGARLFFLTTKGKKNYWDEEFSDGDGLVFGRETKGLPDSLLKSHPENCLTIPMDKEARSLNLATSAGIVLYEAIRQQY